MKLFPAIDILDGRAVRLYKGKRDSVTDYGTPAEVARRWKADGAEYLHVVDLDAAFDGTSGNGKEIERIVRAAGLPVQLGGGIRTLDAAGRALQTGVARVIIGTAAYENPALLRELILRFGADKVVVGLDARDGLVAIKGWVESAPVSAAAFAVQVKEAGIKTLIYTDISRDGALSGVNVAATAALQRETGLQVIASGGVASLDDLRALARAGVHGAILGKALFEGKFTVAEAKKAVEACS